MRATACLAPNKGSAPFTRQQSCRIVAEIAALGVVMTLKILSVALWAATALVSPSHAQSVSQIGAPAELPGAEFAGDQYVDSRGCVFLRAGYGGKPTWVARVGRDRKALCGYPPTLGAMAAKDASAVEAMADTGLADTAPAKVPTFSTPANSKPMDTIASLPEPAKATPRAPTAPVPQASAQRIITVGNYEATGTSGTNGRKIGCYKSVPVAQRVKLVGGGTAVVCTRGDGTLVGWRPPIYPEGTVFGAALADAGAAVQGAANKTSAVQNTVVHPAASAVEHVAATRGADNPPAGYVAAWRDDRLNPNRGKGTAAGWAAQDQVWTRDVPAVLVSEKAAKKVKGTITVSTKSSPEAAVSAPAGSVYIQVGTFGLPANAAGAAARLAAIGLPVAKSNIVRQGKQLQIVLAGPFASISQAQGAVSAVRGAGFSDAFVQ